MSVIRLNCKDCDNNALPRDDGGKYGFFMDAMMTTLVNMDSYRKNIANVIGNELVENPVERIFLAAKNEMLICQNCGSTEVDVICEIDVIKQREQDVAIEQIDENNLIDTVNLDTRLIVPIVDENYNSMNINVDDNLSGEQMIIDTPTMTLDESMLIKRT